MRPNKAPNQITAETAGKITAIFEARGFEVSVTERECNDGNKRNVVIEVLNPFEKSGARVGWNTVLTEGQRHLINGDSLGRIEYTLGHYYVTAEYGGWKRSPKQIGYKFETKKESNLIASVKRDCPMPTQDDYDDAVAKQKAYNARSDEWDRASRKAKLGAKYGERALEVLLESNIEIPEDLKAALDEFMDL